MTPGLAWVRPPARAPNGTQLPWSDFWRSTPSPHFLRVRRISVGLAAANFAATVTVRDSPRGCLLQVARELRPRSKAMSLLRLTVTMSCGCAFSVHAGSYGCGGRGATARLDGWTVVSLLTDAQAHAEWTARSLCSVESGAGSGEAAKTLARTRADGICQLTLPSPACPGPSSKPFRVAHEPRAWNKATVHCRVGNHLRAFALASSPAAPSTSATTSCSTWPASS